MHHFDISDDPFFGHLKKAKFSLRAIFLRFLITDFFMGHLKMVWIQSQNTILRHSRTHFFVRTSENSQTLALDIILRCLRTHYFIQTFEKSYCLSTEHLFKIYNDLFIHLNVWEWWWLSFIEQFWDIQYIIFSFRNTILRCPMIYFCHWNI